MKALQVPSRLDNERLQTVDIYRSTGQYDIDLLVFRSGGWLFLADASILKVVPSPALKLRSNIYTFPCYKLKRVLGSQPARQTDNLYLSTMITKAMQLMGSCINTKPKNKIYT